MDAKGHNGKSETTLVYRPNAPRNASTIEELQASAAIVSKDQLVEAFKDNDGDWQSCRSADGFCWHDWYPEQPGTHRISARVRSGNKWVKAHRTCRVV